MKLNRFRVFSIVFLLLAGMCVTSCKDKEEDDLLPPDQQKTFLEQVALEVASKIKVDDFRHYVELAKFADDHYIEHNSSWDNDVEKWGDRILDDLMGSMVNTTSQTEHYGSYTSVYTYYHYQPVVFASNFKGHWEYKGGKWNYTNANDIQFIFPNQSGQQCVLTAVTSGNEVKVHLFNEDDYKYQTYSGSTSRYYYDRKEYIIGVPEHIVVTLTEAGNKLIEQKVNIDLSSIQNNEFDPSRSKMTFNSNTWFSNGCVFDVNNVAYTTTSATCEFTLTKNGERLVYSTITSDVKNAPSKDMNFWYDIDDDEIENVFANSNATGAFSIDVLGKVQVKGTCSDTHKLVDILDELEDNEEDASAYKDGINKANACYEANVYYNGTETRQAYLRLEAYEEDDYWYGEGYWSYRPLICFPDGTSYTCANWFNEDDFSQIVDEYNRQEDTAEDMW